MDDFQKAAAAAQGRYTKDAWMALPPREQAQAIYAELRRIDAERVAAAVAMPVRRSVGQGSAEAHVKRTVTVHAD